MVVHKVHFGIAKAPAHERFGFDGTTAHRMTRYAFYTTMPGPGKEFRSVRYRRGAFGSPEPNYMDITRKGDANHRSPGAQPNAHPKRGMCSPLIDGILTPWKFVPIQTNPPQI